MVEKEYIVSYIGLLDTKIQMIQVNATSELGALYGAAYYFDFKLPYLAISVGKFKEMCLENGIIVEVLEVG